MDNPVKLKLYQVIDEIEDEEVLNQVLEDVAFYSSKTDVVDELSNDQLKELDKALSEADRNDTISWENFKKEMNEWKNDNY